MNRWKKMAAIAAVLSVTAGAGAAWAQDGGGDNLPPGGIADAPGESTKALGAGRSANKFVPVTPCRLADTRQ
ncbi:MAG: hypothetical protein H0U29_04150, partial [Acidimicrobiia bacterium]|nr:hypothetical protein [Acidimicrobiia bacterium]